MALEEAKRATRINTFFNIDCMLLGLSSAERARAGGNAVTGD